METNWEKQPMKVVWDVEPRGMLAASRIFVKMAWRRSERREAIIVLSQMMSLPVSEAFVADPSFAIS